MEQMSISDIIQDFVSIKLPTNKRKFINEAREQLQSLGGLPISTQDEIRKLSKQYSRQFKELHASRERARRSNWKRREGITEEQAIALVEERNKGATSRKVDLGI